jgi:LacI family transcriptional regulator
MTRHEDARVERNWISSALLTQYEHAGTDRALPLFFADKIEREALLAWLRRQRPDAIVSTEPGVQMLVRRARGSDGERIGFAHLHLAASGLPDCSGIDQNNERVGAAAVDLVIEQLHGNSYGVPANPKTVLIEGRWMPGKTAPLRRNSAQPHT